MYDLFVDTSRQRVNEQTAEAAQQKCSLGKGVLKICSTHMPNVISIKMLSNVIEITLPYGCSPVKLLHIFKTPFPKNTSGGMLLKQENLRRLRSLYKWNCFLINECAEPKAKILGDFAYITCYKRKYTKLYSRGILKSNYYMSFTLMFN